LKEQNLVHVASSGMTLTEEGTALVLALEDFMKELKLFLLLSKSFQKKRRELSFVLSKLELHFAILEKQLKETLDLDEVFVVPGDSDESPWVKLEMGRAPEISFIKSSKARTKAVPSSVKVIPEEAT
jgi:central glycolytic genes regulator